MKKLLSAFTAVCLILSALTVGMPVALATDGETEIWDGSIATSFASGTGTSDDPYIIETAAQLAYMVNCTSTLSGKYIRLTNDIYLNDTSNWENWDSTPPANNWPLYNKAFAGYFNGNGYTVYGLYCQGLKSGGLFHSLNGTVRNLTVKDSYIHATTYAGSMAGYASNSSGIYNCFNYATICSDDMASGICCSVGYIYDCHNYGKTSGISAAGITSNPSIDYTNGYIAYCSNTGEISGTNAAGIADYANTYFTICGCYNTGKITASENAGGIVCTVMPIRAYQPETYGTIYSYVSYVLEHCYNTGTVSGNCAGGIVGNVSAGNSNYKPRSASYNDYFIDYCYNISAVNGKEYAGQIIGNCASYTYTNSSNGSKQTIIIKDHMSNVYYCNTASNVQYGLGNYDEDCSGVKSLSKEKAAQTTSYNQSMFGNISHHCEYSTIGTTHWVMSGNPDYPYPELQNNRQPHDHAYTETVNAEATCTQDGSKTLTCWCGDTYDDIIPASGHSYESTVNSEPTCTEDGLKTLTCSCGDTYTEVIPATGHSHVESVQEATCTTAGLKTYTCSCGDTYTETIPANGHELITVTVEATCTEDGETYTQCSTCKTVFGEKEILPASGHSHTSTVTTKATCTTAGVKTFTCGCGDTYTENIPATGHALKLVSQANTCTSAGFEYYICDNCGNMIGDTEYLPKLGHDYKSTVKTAATCTQAGEKLYDCSRCEVSYTEEIPATGHSFGEWVQTKAPTCTAAGTERRDCKNCDEYETRDVAVTAHDWEDDYTVDKAATCTEKGSRSIHCKDCSATKSVTEIPALSHDYKSVVTAPTCTEKGYTTHTCAVCKDSYIDSEVKANGHSYNAVVTAPDCENKGYTTHTCSVCKDSYTDSFANATGHTYKENVTAQPSCTTAGVKTFTCDCGDSYTQAIPALGHSVGDWEYDSGNTYIKKCSVCKTVIDSEDRNNYEISIKNNSGSKTVNYGETLQLTAIVPDAPEGAKIFWYVDGVKKGEGETFEVSPGEKSVKVAVKLVDSNGEVIVNYNGKEVSDEQTVNVNAGFFQKLISFFKNLFRISRIVVQSFTGLQ